MTWPKKWTYDQSLFEHPFSIGDMVFKLDISATPGQSCKLQPIYTGPLLVEKVLSTVTYHVLRGKRSGAAP